MLFFSAFRITKRAIIAAVETREEPSVPLVFISSDTMVTRDEYGKIHVYHINSISYSSDTHICGYCTEGDSQI